MTADVLRTKTMTTTMTVQTPQEQRQLDWEESVRQPSSGSSSLERGAHQKNRPLPELGAVDPVESWPWPLIDYRNRR